MPHGDSVSPSDFRNFVRALVSQQTRGLREAQVGAELQRSPLPPTGLGESRVGLRLSEVWPGDIP